MAYRDEFDTPELPQAADLLARGYVDTSWRNDSCPTFVSPCQTIRVWIEHPDADKREDPGQPQFGVERGDFNPDSETYGESAGFECSDDWPHVLGLLQA